MREWFMIRQMMGVSCTTDLPSANCSQEYEWLAGVGYGNDLPHLNEPEPDDALWMQHDDVQGSGRWP